MNDNKFDLIIEAGKVERHYWLDLWRYRELFFVLAWRDIIVRYKQTIIGIIWAIIRPLLIMTILVVIFSKLAHLPSEGVPYPIFVFAATLPWIFFSTAFSSAGNSLIGNTSLISKVYFPRLILPISSVIVALVDFLISFAILLMLMFWYELTPSWHLLILPPLLLICFLAALGAGLIVTSLNVRYRDFKFIIPFVTQLGLYISPVAFSTNLVPEQYKIFFYLNPLVAIIDGFRWAISGGNTAFNMLELYISISVVTIFCIVGFFYFRKTERTFADVI